MAVFNEKDHPRAPKGAENGGEFVEKTTQEIYLENIKKIEDETGIKFKKSNTSNSWYSEKDGLEIRISDHFSKFEERTKALYDVSAVDLPIVGLPLITMVRIINQTDPFINYKKGDTIRHRSDRIGDTKYIDSDYKKEWILVKTKDNREVKYFSEAFFNYLDK